MFRKTAEHEQFFKKIYKDGVFQIDFDTWYLCFFIGVVKGEKQPAVPATDMLGYFPSKYSAVEGLLIAMLLRAELADKGIEASERASVQKAVDQLIDPNARPPLSSAGFKAFNEYAAGGYEVIQAALNGQPPEDAAAFLIKYADLLKDTVSSSELW